MIPLPSGTKIWLVAGITDMRNGFNGLAAKVQCIMSNRVSTVPALLFAYHHHSLLTALPVTGFLH